MDFTEINNTLYCAFSKRLDSQVCSTIEEKLLRRSNEFRENHEDSRLVFDLDGVIFVSSTFLRLCLMHFKMFGKDRFSIVNVSEEIHAVFHVSGFAEMMNVARLPSQQTAG